MTDLPPEVAAFASLLDAQPEPVRGAFAYCLAKEAADQDRHIAVSPPVHSVLSSFPSIFSEFFWWWSAGAMRASMPQRQAAPMERPDQFGDPSLAPAGLDRLTHHPAVLIITGSSFPAQGRHRLP